MEDRVTLQQEISSLWTAINRFESRLDDSFNAFQAKFLTYAKLLLEKAFGKSINFPVAILQSCEESDDSSLAVDFVESKVQVATTIVSNVVEFSDRLLEPPLVQGVALTELAETEQELLLTSFKELKVFDELSVITYVESDGAQDMDLLEDDPNMGLRECPQDKASFSRSVGI
ncbi:hypothetical protein GQ457_14G012070 [Hibiscus cannabinus]